MAQTAPRGRTPVLLYFPALVTTSPDLPLEPARPANAYLTPSASTACVGIDLAGVERRETGVAVLRDGRLELLRSAGTDDEILALVATAGFGATVGINAPLTRPRGRCCLHDECPCRSDPGTRSREIERELGRMRIPTLATALIKVLARRGCRMAAALRVGGWEPLEVYPYATLRLLGLPTQGKRTPLGRRRIHQALQPLVPGLDHPDASEHQLDAVVCALTAQLWRQGRARTVGAADEGLMTIPDVAGVPVPADASPPRRRRAAESRAQYAIDDATSPGGAASASRGSGAAGRSRSR